MAGVSDALAFFDKAPLWFWLVVVACGVAVVFILRRGVVMKKEVVEVKTTKSPSAEAFAAGSFEAKSDPLDIPYETHSLPAEPMLGAVKAMNRKLEQIEAAKPKPPLIIPPQFNGGDDNINKAMEYVLVTALLNSAPGAMLDGLEMETKFGKVVFRKQGRQAPVAAPSQTVVPQVAEPPSPVEVPEPNKDDVENG